MMMDREAAIAALKQERDSGNTEIAHRRADDILRELLTALGYADVVAEYDLVDKWYA